MVYLARSAQHTGHAPTATGAAAASFTSTCRPLSFRHCRTYGTIPYPAYHTCRTPFLHAAALPCTVCRRTPLLRSQPAAGSQPTNAFDEWMEQLWGFAMRAATVICIAVYATMFLSAVFTFVSAFANTGIVMADQSDTTGLRYGLLALAMGALPLVFYEGDDKTRR